MRTTKTLKFHSITTYLATKEVQSLYETLGITCVLVLRLLHLMVHRAPVLTLVDPLLVNRVVVIRILHGFQMCIAATHDGLLHVVQAVPGQLGWSFGVNVAHDVLAQDIEATQLVNHGDCVRLHVLAQVCQPIAREVCVPFGDAVGRGELKPDAVAEGQQDGGSLDGPFLGIVVPNVA